MVWVRIAGMAVLAVALVGVVGLVHAGEPKPLDAMSPAERQQVEQRVSEMEADMRGRRDAALITCRGGLANCQTKTCGKVPHAQTGPWQECQDNCESSYQTCLGRARAIWPEEP
jgi:hypothetical protein